MRDRLRLKDRFAERPLTLKDRFAIRPLTLKRLNYKINVTT